MNENRSQGAATLSSLALLLALGGCGDRVENTEMPLPAQANVEINRQGMEGAKQAEAANGVEHQTATMGAAPAATAQAPAAPDPDLRIAADVQARLASDPDIGAAKIDVHSEDGVITLRGRAPDPIAKEKAGALARNMPDVKSVDNQLTLG